MTSPGTLALEEIPDVLQRVGEFRFHRVREGLGPGNAAALGGHGQGVGPIERIGVVLALHSQDGLAVPRDYLDSVPPPVGAPFHLFTAAYRPQGDPVFLFYLLAAQRRFPSAVGRKVEVGEGVAGDHYRRVCVLPEDEGVLKYRVPEFREQGRYVQVLPGPRMTVVTGYHEVCTVPQAVAAEPVQQPAHLGVQAPVRFDGAPMLRAVVV